MDYDPELFGKALPCLIAIGCALPPDYSLSKNTDDDFKPTGGNPDQPHYNPEPILTHTINLNNDLNTITQKFCENYHDAWASRKFENSWVYDNQWSDTQKTHPRLKPYKSSKGTRDRKIARARSDSFFPCSITDISGAQRANKSTKVQ